MVNAIKQTIEYYSNNRSLPDVIVVLTDGYCDWSELHKITEPLIIVCITDTPIPQTPNVVIIRAKEGD
jgi:regulation of enolase protein 1 (concanavalin A-like superfamily)